MGESKESYVFLLFNLSFISSFAYPCARYPPSMTTDGDNVSINRSISKAAYHKLPETPHMNIFEDRFKNIKRIGITHHRLADTYYMLINMKWGFLFLVVLFFYMLLATIFATGYFIFRKQFDPPLDDFADCFFLGIGIITNQGSGIYVAKGIPARFVVLVEAVCGMITLALLTGLIYSKFSRPSPRITFSKVIAMTISNGKPVLQFRVANERDNFCNDVTLNLAVFLAEVTLEGTIMRRLHDLKLTREKIPVFAMAHLANHIVDETSPLFGKSVEELIALRAEFWVQIFGTDAAYEQTVHKNHLYAMRDLVVNHKFEDMISFNSEGTAIMDLRKMHSTIPLSADILSRTPSLW